MLVSTEETKYTSVAMGVYKITLLAYLNSPNIIQTGCVTYLSHLEDKEIKIIAVHK